MRCFVLLDRDGTLNVDRHYLSDPEKVELLPNAALGLRQLANCGLGLVVITNQSGIGRGLFSMNCLESVHERLRELLETQGVRLDGIYVCPHLPEEHCLCRKPRRGLVDKAASELGFDSSTAFVIGDKRSDIELGKSLGATTLLVRTGEGVTTAADESVRPDYVVNDLLDAARVIAGAMADRAAPGTRSGSCTPDNGDKTI